MTGKMIGYVRVSTFEQNSDRQLENLKLDKIYIDKASGKDINRPELEAMLGYVRDGDTIVVHSMDRLARNLDDLRSLVFMLNQKQIKIQFIKENLIFTGEDSPMANLLLSVMGAFAEFERAIIRERQLEGIALAKKRGVYKGRKKALDEDQIKSISEKLTLGMKKSEIAKELNISRETLYQYLRLENVSTIIDSSDERV
jgi:DNA invertase Pin-like site-specific DNA recombinase